MLIRLQSRRVVEYLPGDDDLVGAREREELRQPARDRLGPADDRIGQHAVELLALERAQGRGEPIGIDGRRHRAELAAAQREEHLLVRREEPPRFLVCVGRDDVDAEHQVRALERARARLRG